MRKVEEGACGGTVMETFGELLAGGKVDRTRKQSGWWMQQ